MRTKVLRSQKPTQRKKEEKKQQQTQDQMDALAYLGYAVGTTLNEEETKQQHQQQ